MDDDDSSDSESNDSESISERVNCKCGKEGQQRIVGGNVVSVRNYYMKKRN